MMRSPVAWLAALAAAARSQTLLLHIAYYHHEAPRAPHCDSGVLKGDATWTAANLAALRRQVLYAENYTDLRAVEVVVDTNSAALEPLAALGALGALRRARVRFDVWAALAHPFHLTSRHRLDMRRRLADFDWFMYTEADTTMPPPTFHRQLVEAAALWADAASGPSVRTFARVCADRRGNCAAEQNYASASDKAN